MLKQRILTALLIGLPMIAILLWMPRSMTIGLFGVAVLLGAWEWSSFVKLTRSSDRTMYLVLIAASLIAVWTLFNRQPQPVLLVALFGWLVALLLILFAPEKGGPRLAAVGGFYVMVPAWLSLTLLHVHLPRGPEWVLYLFLLVVWADIGGFIFGRWLGKHKLVPRVSPGKTWEGLAGGLLLSGIVAVVGSFWLGRPHQVAMLPFITLSVLTVLVSVVGDLTESLFKRHAGLKDSGGLLPGHGGVLDRIDSICAAAPFFLAGLIYLGVYG